MVEFRYICLFNGHKYVPLHCLPGQVFNHFYHRLKHTKRYNSCDTTDEENETQGAELIPESKHPVATLAEKRDLDIKSFLKVISVQS